MSIYPQAAAGQGLYETSDVPKAKLGTEMSFQTDNGVVYARYMQNSNGTSSIAAGFGVGFAGSGFGFDTARLNNASAQMNFFAGIVATSHSGSYYGWVIYKGPCAAPNLTASVASSAATRAMAMDSAGRWITTVSTAATDNWLAAGRVLGCLRTNANTFTTGPATNQIMDIYWK